MTPNCSFSNQALQKLQSWKHWIKWTDQSIWEWDGTKELPTQGLSLFRRPPPPCQSHTCCQATVTMKAPCIPGRRHSLWTALTVAWLVVSVKVNKSVSGLRTRMHVYFPGNTSQQESLWFSKLKRLQTWCGMFVWTSWSKSGHWASEEMIPKPYE